VKKTKHIWIFSDGIKGHETQSLALAKSLSNSCQIFNCGIRQPWLSFAPRILPRFGRNILWFGQPADAKDSPSLIITCGRRMAAVGKYYKRRCACKHIQILNPGDNPSKYDVLLVPEHDGITAKNIIRTKGSLHVINSGFLQQIRQRYPEFSQNQAMIGFFVGNPNKKFIKQLPTLAKQIQQHYPKHKIMLSGSRRTSKTLKKALKQHFNQADLIWFSEEDGENPYQKLLAFCDLFLVTADSINMLSEACATNKKVVALAAETASLKHQRFVQSLSSRISALSDDVDGFQPLETLETVSMQLRKFIN